MANLIQPSEEGYNLEESDLLNCLRCAGRLVIFLAFEYLLIPHLP